MVAYDEAIAYNRFGTLYDGVMLAARAHSSPTVRSAARSYPTTTGAASRPEVD